MHSVSVVEHPGAAGSASKKTNIMTHIEIAQKQLEARIEGMRQRFEADVKAGAMDAAGKVYDKWYRNHRSDNGAAYDAGWWDEYAKTPTHGFQVING